MSPFGIVAIGIVHPTTHSSESTQSVLYENFKSDAANY